jgi:phenylacetic acid degradation operon negative regulatory protein
VKRSLSISRSIPPRNAVPRVAQEALAKATASELIYSSLSFYARRRGGELSGAWIVDALAELKVAPATTRKTLWRMEREGELLSRRTGRAKRYRATPLAWAEIETGADKILRPLERSWDGRWTVVAYAFEGSERVERERIRAVLNAEGFGSIGPGMFVHPRDRGGRIIAAADEQGLGARLEAFRGRRLSSGTDAEFVRCVWNLREPARRYRRFRKRYGPLTGRARTLPPPVAFALRFAVVLDYLAAAWSDPELPPRLLARDWPGPHARALAGALYRDLLPAALEHGDAIRDRVA